MKLQNKFAALTGENEDSVDVLMDYLSEITTESAVAVGGRERGKETGKLFPKTQEPLQKPRRMNVSQTQEQIELEKLSKLYDRSKVGDFRSYNIAKIEETLERGGILRATSKKLGVG